MSSTTLAVTRKEKSDIATSSPEPIFNALNETQKLVVAEVAVGNIGWNSSIG